MTQRVVDAVAARRFVGALFGSAPAGSLVELRTRRGQGMRQSFHRAEAIDEVVGEIVRGAVSVDVFVGVVPRARRGGGRRDLVERASVLWVDCDAPAAVAALRAFRPAPSIAVASGGRGRRHAYWLLAEPVAIDEVEHANRRLARELGADLTCSEPARILRPAGSVWHKSSPPVPVRLLHVDTNARHSLGDVVGRLGDVTVALVAVPARQRAGRDPLLAISPLEYVQRLSGDAVGHDGKMRCPFHDDQTPSLHVFAEPERGWYCFGCGRGGSIYDFAALLWRAGTRGDDFMALRARLSSRFGMSA